MTEAVKKEFEFKRGSLMLVPYDPRTGFVKEEALITLYKRLKDEDLWDIVFHEEVDITLLKFMKYFSEGQALLQILTIVDNDGNIVDAAGMAWVSDLVVCGNMMTRGIGSFLFFKDYQKPMYTDQFSEMLFDYWFGCLGIDVIVGVTPEPNRAALIYIKRAGMKEAGRIPDYTTYKGQIVTGVVTSLAKKDYESLVGG